MLKFTSHFINLPAFAQWWVLISTPEYNAFLGSIFKKKKEERKGRCEI